MEYEITCHLFRYWNTRETYQLQEEIDSISINFRQILENIRQQILEKEKQLSSLREIQANSSSIKTGTKLFSL